MFPPTARRWPISRGSGSRGFSGCITLATGLFGVTELFSPELKVELMGVAVIQA